MMENYLRAIWEFFHALPVWWPNLSNEQIFLCPVYGFCKYLGCRFSSTARIQFSTICDKYILQYMPLFCWDQWDFSLGFTAARISLLMLITHAWPCRQGSHCNLECLKKEPVPHDYWAEYEDSLYVSERQRYT